MSHFFRWHPSRVITSAVVILMAAGCYYSQTSPASLAGEQPELIIPHAPVPTPAPNTLHSYHRSISFSPDGRKLASAEAEGSIQIFDVTTGNMLMTLKAYEGVLERIEPPVPRTGIRGVTHFGARKIRFSPDGEWLASISDDSTMRIWDATTGTEVHRIHIDRYSNDFTWSPDSGRLATFSPSGFITLWDATTGKQLSSFSIFSTQSLASIPRPVLIGIIFTPAGQLLTGTWLERGLRLWDVSSGLQIRSIRLSNPLDKIVPCCNGKGLAVVEWRPLSCPLPIIPTRDIAFLIDLETGERHPLATSADHVMSFAVSPDGSRIAFTTWKYKSHQFSIKVYAAGQKQPIRSFTAEDSFDDLAFSPDSKLLAASGKTIRIWRYGQ